MGRKSRDYKYHRTPRLTLVLFMQLDSLSSKTQGITFFKATFENDRKQIF